MKKIALSLTLLITTSLIFAQTRKEVVYKTIDTTVLKMSIYYPSNYQSDKKYPAIVFFFGGGWNSGTNDQFENHAKYFAQRGLICFLPDYRVNKRQKTTPIESLKDAKSAMRYVRAHASELHVDTSMIVASGGSAGGHLAAATAIVEGYNESTDNLKVGCVPNALVLYNPVIDNGPGGYGYERIGNEYKNFSPLHNLRKGTPPTLFFLGTKDHLIPVATAEYYKTVMEKTGSRCDLILYEGQEHGFFNYKMHDNYKRTIAETDQFLQSLGYLKKEPVVEIN